MISPRPPLSSRPRATPVVGAAALAVLLAVALGGARPAAANPAEPPSPAAATLDEATLREQAYPGEQPASWRAAPSRVQAEQDTTLVPVGKGAIFVPMMTDGLREPKYMVLREGDIVDTVQTGRKIVLDPGIYTVRIGSGAVTDRFARRVLVKEGRTTIVPATWSGLVVNVVDERSVPFRGTYELIKFPERTNLGIGLGADVELGEEVRAWLLEPGTYMVIKTGESYQARTDFYTFRLQKGELYRLTLVMNRDDGSLLGAGQTSISEQETTVQDWNLHLSVGGDAEFNRRSDVVGFPSGYGFTLGGYVDFVARYKPERHFFYSRLKLEEKQVKFPTQPWQKDLDEWTVDALYMYRILPWVGPYGRAGMQTTLFPGKLHFSDPTDIVETRSGDVLGTGKRDFELSKPFAPIELKGGVGMSFLITASYILDAQIRIGVGGRVLFNRDLLTTTDVNATPEYEVTRKGDAYQYGVESTVVASLRITRWVIATTEFDFLEPFGDYQHPIVDWETTVGFRLVSFASINYIFKLLSDSERSEHLQTEHRVLLRFTWRIL